MPVQKLGQWLNIDTWVLSEVIQVRLCSSRGRDSPTEGYVAFIVDSGKGEEGFFQRQQQAQSLQQWVFAS
jgi:hypothetical protein